MNLIRWDPFRDLEHIREEMKGFLSRMPFQGSWQDLSGFEPRVDVSETEKDLKVTVELPGVADKDDLDIVVLDDMLQIKGEIRQEKESKEENFHQRERFYGGFFRTVKLPVEVKKEEATAKYENGLLIVNLPKKDPLQGRGHRIQIQ